MILWTLISIVLIVLMIRETRASENLWASFTNPGWGYVATMWFVGSLTLWMLKP